jgi:hypothetical protein
LYFDKVFGRRGGAAGAGPVNGVDYKLRTPLHRAALLGVSESVRILLGARAVSLVAVQSDGPRRTLTAVNGSVRGSGGRKG